MDVTLMRLGLMLFVAATLGGCAETGTDAAIGQCVGTGFRADDTYVGREARTVTADVVASGQSVRVLGRDGGCEDRDDDRDADRVNLYIVDGLVAWAGSG